MAFGARILEPGEVEDSYKAGGHEFEHSRVHYELLPGGKLRVNTTSHCTYNIDVRADWFLIYYCVTK